MKLPCVNTCVACTGCVVNVLRLSSVSSTCWPAQPASSASAARLLFFMAYSPVCTPVHARQVVRAPESHNRARPAYALAQDSDSPAERPTAQCIYGSDTRKGTQLPRCAPRRTGDAGEAGERGRRQPLPPAAPVQGGVRCFAARLPGCAPGGGREVFAEERQPRDRRRLRGGLRLGVALLREAAPRHARARLPRERQGTADRFLQF